MNAKSLGVKPDDFWTRLQVYPAAGSNRQVQRKDERRARKMLEGCAAGNLLYACEAAAVTSRPGKDSASQLIERLLKSNRAREITCLASFLYKRQAAFLEYYDNRVSETLKVPLETRVTQLSPRPPELIRPITKILAVYADDPTILEAIHYYYAWRRLPTIFSFTVEGGISKGDIATLSQAIQSLVTRLDKLIQGESYDYFGNCKISDSTTVFVLHRRYPPAVRSDYQAKYRLQYDYGTVAFGADPTGELIRVKTTNKMVAEAIEKWIEHVLRRALLPTGHSLFRDYTADSVESCLLGGYDESAGIDLIELELGQSSAPGHSCITVTRGGFSGSIRMDLRWLRESGLLRIRSLSDITRLRVLHRQNSIEIRNEPETGGARRLKANDSEVPEDVLRSLHDAFPKAFMLPLDQSIDPTVFSMGPADVYQYLLSGRDDSEVQDYHRPALAKLLSSGLLKETTEFSGRCTNAACSRRDQIQRSKSKGGACEACGHERVWIEQLRHEPNPEEIGKQCREILKQAVGGRLPSTTMSFESRRFHRLSWKEKPNRTVCVFINDRVHTDKLDAFRQANFPILVIHPHGRHRGTQIDDLGLGHVGLPYMLAAHEDKQDWTALRRDCRGAVERLLRMEQERVLRASRHSHDRLSNMPLEYNDRMFESDAYNILRSIFPYTVKWGGGSRPDGFSSLAYFEENDLSKPRYFNWSYDAKYSEDTYDFAIGEFRQMFEYIRKLYQPKRLKSLGNRFDAHAIITNSMKVSSMKAAAEYLWNTHRLGAENPAFLLLFIRSEFLTKLWDRLRSDEVEFRKRASYVPEEFVGLASEKLADGFVLLDEEAASELAENVLSQPPIESPIDADALASDLKRAKTRAKMPGARSRR